MLNWIVTVLLIRPNQTNLDSPVNLNVHILDGASKDNNYLL